MSRLLHRDAVTGKLVTAAFAAEHPDTTVTETVSDLQRGKEILDAVDEHLKVAASLLADLQQGKEI